MTLARKPTQTPTAASSSRTPWTLPQKRSPRTSSRPNSQELDVARRVRANAAGQPDQPEHQRQHEDAPGDAVVVERAVQVEDGQDPGEEQRASRTGLPSGGCWTARKSGVRQQPGGAEATRAAAQQPRRPEQVRQLQQQGDGVAGAEAEHRDAVGVEARRHAVIIQAGRQLVGPQRSVKPWPTAPPTVAHRYHGPQPEQDHVLGSGMAAPRLRDPDGEPVPELRGRNGPADRGKRPLEADGPVSFLPLQHVARQFRQRAGAAEEAGTEAEDVERSIEVIRDQEARCPRLTIAMTGSSTGCENVTVCGDADSARQADDVRVGRRIVYHALV